MVVVQVPPLHIWSFFLFVFCCVTIKADQVYKALYTGSINNQVYQTVPKKVTPTGEHLSHDLTHFYNDAIYEKLHFNITIHDKDHFIVLEPSNDFIAPTVILERRKRDIHTRVKPKFKSKNCHFKGVIHGQENSKVALSTCNGLTGLLHTEMGKYYIEPVYHSSKQIEPAHPHLIFKRSSVSNKKKRKRKRRKLTKDCGVREPRKMTELEWQRQIGKVKVQEKKHKLKHKVDIPSVHQSDLKKHRYKKVDSRQRRSISKPQYVETLVVADPTMVEFHEDGDIEIYLLTIMNMVSSLYLDPSIGNLVKIVVVKIILMDDPQASPFLNITHSADHTLRSFCKWQRNVNPSEEDIYHHDVAILVTRKDICARQNDPCSTLGVAHVGGMCKTGKSCSVNEDNGITLAHTIAHELGHNFGMYHDTEKIGCKPRHGNTSHIMTPSFEADTVGVSWSRCSRRDITNFLDKGLGSCLHDEPPSNAEYEYPELPPGAVYDANYQCRFQFGGNATVCSSPDEICLRLWCLVNDTCTTQLKPAAPGTNCGKHKWCQEQRCVPIQEPPVRIDGGWGDWNEWSECSQTCGAGVSIIERQCDHPTPAGGGIFCVGHRRRYRLCNTEPCPEGMPTFRAIQCTKHNNKSYEGKKYEWQPYFDQEEPCQLYCSDANETVIVPWGDYAADGTPCNVGSRDVCISGICRRVGCDWVVDSTASEDDCGICQGDGTRCEKVEGSYTKQSLSPGYREVVVIPTGARNIRIKEVDHSENYLAIGSAFHKKFYLNGKRFITLGREYTVAGAQCLYERENELEKIRIPGPIKEPIVIYILFRGKTPNPGVHYSYSLWKRETTRQLNYTWIMGDWSQCSATCGGGKQERRPLCLESTVGVLGAMGERARVVDEAMCEGAGEEARRSCNEDPCPTQWWVGPWQSCPVTCKKGNENPMKRRSVMCVDGQKMALPDRFCDRHVKPLENTNCRSLPKC